MLFACTAAVASTPPPWQMPNFSQRVVFSFSERSNPYVLVTLPHEQELAEEPELSVVDSEHKTLKHRVIYSDTKETTILVSSSGTAHRERCAAYYCPVDLNAKTNLLGKLEQGRSSSRRVDVLDPSPVWTSMHSFEGQGLPSTWDEMRYLYAHSSGSPQIRRCETFMGEGITTYSPYDRSNRRSTRRRGSRSGPRIIRMRSWIYIPDSGDYRFSMSSPNAAFLFVDHLPATSTSSTGTDEWQTGSPVTLKAGVRLIEAWVSMEAKPSIEIAWQTPGADGPPVEIPEVMFITGAAAKNAQHHAANKTLYPTFKYDIESNYSFRCSDTTFHRTSFYGSADSWLQGSLEYRWAFDRNDTSSLFAPGTPRDAYVTDRRPVHVFTGRTRHAAVLEVRDSLGFVSRKEQVIDCRLEEPLESSLAARVISLPATCYGRDVIEPLFHLSGNYSRAHRTFTLSWKTTSTDGTTETFAQEIEPSSRPARIPMGRMKANRIASLSWSIGHANITLDTGTVRFLPPPFSELPVTAQGDRLYAKNGDRLILVPYECADRYTQPPLEVSGSSTSIVCIDDTLSDATPIADGKQLRFDHMLARTVPSKTSYVSFHSWASQPGMLGSLIKLVKTPARIPKGTDIVVLSVGLQDMLNAMDPAVFERQAAALTDIVSTTLKYPVVWVTPPTYPYQPQRSRQFATAVMRVADARRVPVADLFSVCSINRDGNSALAEGLSFSLSDTGQELAARLIAETLITTGSRK